MTRRFQWGHGIAAVYIAFAAGTLAFVAFAASQPVDLVSTDYYERSLEHDARRAAMTRAQALGAAVKVDVQTDPRAVLLTLPVSDAPVVGRAHLYRPADATADLTWDLAPDAAGRQHLPLGDAPAGRWILQLEWSAGEAPYYLERTLTLP